MKKPIKPVVGVIALIVASVGLVLAIFCSLIGMVVSIIAYNKSKTAGFKNNFALAGIIVGAVSMVVGVVVNLTYLNR